MSSSGFSRRDFLRIAGAGAAVAGTATVTGCSVHDTSGSTKSGSSKPNRTIRYAMSGAVTTADTADPALSNTQHDGRLMTAVYEQLSRYDESLRATPWLAESWSSNAKGDVWEFKLRNGVAFHNGDRFTAKDVEYTFRRLLDPKTASPVAAELSSLEPDGVRAINDGTVEFRLKAPDAELPLSLISKQTYIVPNGANSADLRRQAVGTGPFRLKEFTPGDPTTVFVRNSGYWQTGLPGADTFQLTSIAEEGSRLAALKRGQVDIIENPPASSLASLRGGDTVIVSQAKGDMELIAVQMDRAPFDDVRVRQALKYALDRRVMLQLVAQQQAMVLNDIPIADRLQYALQDPARAHDVAKARALLAEAGHAGGLTVKLSVSNVQARFMDFATAYKDMAAQAGIDLQLDVTPADSYWDKVWLKTPMFVSAWIARPTSAMLRLLFLSKSSNNETHWFRPDWDARFRKAQGTLDEAGRAQLYRELQREVVDEGGYLVPYMHATLAATRKDIQGWKPSGTFFERFELIERS
jgi:peptide/nickel transport system substrate-binding protein